ncbi:uncharacterized protein [Apostichopus japonicus]|uniref:uncharacterized protein isoform X2 n=1 Tax=Stichopus japonicus TaxID=307972 RepID=UPI003AB8643D
MADIVILLLLLLTLGHSASFTSGNQYGCTSPQYLERGLEDQVIDCTLPDEYYGIYWYDKSDTATNEAIVSYQGGNRDGLGYRSGKVNITSDGLLQIKLVTVEHEHEYEVLVINKDQNESEKFIVSVIVYVKPLQEDPNIDVCHGKPNCLASVSKDTSISCSVEGARPVSTVQWFEKTQFDETLLKSSYSDTSVNFTFSSFALTSVTFSGNNFFKMLICKSFNQAPSIVNGTATVLLEISQPQYSLVFNNTESGHENTQIALECTNSEQSVLLWKRKRDMEYETIAYRMNNLSIVTMEDYTLSSSGSLVIATLKVHHGGEYACFYGPFEHYNYNGVTLNVDVPPHEGKDSSTVKMWIIICIVIFSGMLILSLVFYIRHRRQKTKGYSDKLQRTRNMEEAENIFNNAKETWNKGGALAMTDEVSQSTVNLDIGTDPPHETNEIHTMSTFGKTTTDGEKASSSGILDEETKDGFEETSSITNGEQYPFEASNEAGFQDVRPNDIADEIKDIDQPHDVLTLGSDIMILMDNAIKSYTWEGKLVKKYQKEGFKPFAGAAYEGKLYVTDKESKCIVTFDNNLNRLNEFGNDHLAEPGGITVCAGKGFLLVLNGRNVENAGISVFKLDGTYVKDFGSRELSDPWYIKCNYRNELLVSDNGNKKMKTFDIDTEKLVDSFSTNLDGTPMHCRGISVDQENNIYVALRAPGYRSQMECIIKYNAQGFQLQKYLESPPPNQTFKNFWKSMPLGHHIDSIAEDVLSVGRKSEGLSFARGLHFIERWDEQYLMIVDAGNKRVSILEITSRNKMDF